MCFSCIERIEEGVLHEKIGFICGITLLPIMAGCSVEVTVDNPRPEVYAFISSETSTGQVGEIISGLEKAADDFRLSIETIQMDLSNHPDDAFKRLTKQSEIHQSPYCLFI